MGPFWQVTSGRWDFGSGLVTLHFPSKHKHHGTFWPDREALSEHQRSKDPSWDLRRPKRASYSIAEDTNAAGGTLASSRCYEYPSLNVPFLWKHSKAADRTLTGHFVSEEWDRWELWERTAAFKLTGSTPHTNHEANLFGNIFRWGDEIMNVCRVNYKKAD